MIGGRFRAACTGKGDNYHNWKELLRHDTGNRECYSQVNPSLKGLDWICILKLKNTSTNSFNH